jgi:2-oxoglutarate dehydrogenase E2 component (dihydrolipoamide succinyltransferase)
MVFETAKNDAAVRTTEAGVITEFLVAEGDDVEVGANIFVLDTDGKRGEGAPVAEAPKEENKATETKSAEAPAPTPAPVQQAPTPAPVQQAPTPAPVQQAQPAKEKPDMTAPPKAPAPSKASPSSGAPGRTERREKMSRMRRTVAANLKGSQNTNATVTTFQELDMHEIMTLRKELGEEFMKRNG